MTRRRPAVLLTAGATGAASSIAVGLVERGAANFNAPLRPYLGDVTLIGSGFSFLRSFIDSRPVYSAPVRAHPPGFVLGLWTLDWAHLQGPGWASAAVIIGAALATVVAAVVFDDRWWPVAAVAIGTALLWPAPEPAAMFVGVTALAALAAVCGRRWATALGAGVLLGAALLLSYQAIVAAGAVVAVLAARRRFRTVALLAIGCLAVLVLVDLAGFSYIAGFGTL